MTDAKTLPPPSQPPALMAELEDCARGLLALGTTPAWAALTVCLRAGLEHPGPVAIDLAERIRA